VFRLRVAPEAPAFRVFSAMPEPVPPGLAAEPDCDCETVLTVSSERDRDGSARHGYCNCAA